MNRIVTADLMFLAVFCVVVTLFLFKNRENLKREGLIYLYRTKWGMQAISYFSKKTEGFIHRIKYFVIFVAFILLILILLLLVSNAYAYLTSPKLTIELTNGAPPIAPLLPYFPQIFGMESFFPDFYFSYFLIALAIVAIAHEFAHGVFMKTFGVKIKSTGILFLGPILGAFVEEDKNKFEKKTNSEQMAILGAGVFANFILAVIFFLSLILFFNLSYSPAGYLFSGYAISTINTSNIVGFENYSSNLTKVITASESYLVPNEFYLELIKNEEYLKGYSINVYSYSPAIRNQLKGAIVELDGEKVFGLETFSEKMQLKKPGETINLKTIYLEKVTEYKITLDVNPQNSSKGFLGIVSFAKQKRLSFKGVVSYLLNFKDATTYYEPVYNKDLAEFIYYLIWWIALINLFVAMFNMLPLGILDGGRFTYLFILSITKSEKKSKRLYNFILSTVGIIFLLIIIGWIFAKFF